jgi:carbonic anhydrase/acetyltransferase-like protein (isoleucine patch superfamily)
LRDYAVVGMGAIVLDGAVIEEEGILGANGLWPPGKRIGPSELWLGNPARLVRVMTPDEVLQWMHNPDHYVELGKRHRAALVQQLAVRQGRFRKSLVPIPMPGWCSGA